MQKVVIDTNVIVSSLISSGYPSKIISDDPDNRLLELAIESNADFLITGNTNDFELNSIGKAKIVSPSIYWLENKPDLR